MASPQRIVSAAACNFRGPDNVNAPLEYVWQGGAWHPLPYYAKQAQLAFGEGEIARLERIEHRSVASHKAFFAWVQEAYENLPEGYRGRWVSPDDFRHWLLTFTKFCTRHECIMPSKAAANAMKKFLDGDYHRTVVEGNTFIGYKAMSQSYRSMSARAFQESREAFDTVAAQVLGIHPDDIKRNAGRAA